MYDVAVIGCGITGASCAFELSKYNLSVIALERENDVATGTTKANSAIVHAGYDPKAGTLMASLNVRGNELIWELCEKLDVPHRRCGSLVLAFNKIEYSVLTTMLQRGEQNGVKDLAIIDKKHLHEIEPNVSTKAIAALYAPSAGIISPWELTLALAETAVKNGMELLLDAGVQAVQKTDAGYRIEHSRGAVDARYVINAAGVDADKVHNMAAKPSFCILPKRGEYYLLDKSEGERVRHVVFRCPTKAGKGVLVAPTVHGNLIVGPSNEVLDCAHNTATTSAGLAKVSKAAARLVPSIKLSEAIRNFAGVRAASDHDDFIIAEAEGAPGWIDMAGIKSPGLTAAPAAAQMTVKILREAGLGLAKKENFVYERKRVKFAGLTPEEKTALIKENPAYGRVICRCETVTEGEILDAMHGAIPPRSIDGVKRRTGAGMGRCQGGFCGPRIVELISRELGFSPTEIPQDLCGSELLIGETKEETLL